MHVHPQSMATRAAPFLWKRAKSQWVDTFSGDKRDLRLVVHPTSSVSKVAAIPEARPDHEVLYPARRYVVIEQETAASVGDIRRRGHAFVPREAASIAVQREGRTDEDLPLPRIKQCLAESLSIPKIVREQLSSDAHVDFARTTGNSSSWPITVPFECPSVHFRTRDRSTAIPK